MAILYGASAAGVQALLPTRPPFSSSTEPTDTQVAELLDQVSQWVAIRVQPQINLLDGDDAQLANDHAKGLVHLGTAALVENGGHPELAGVNETSLGTVLWDQFKLGLDHLAQSLGEETPGGLSTRAELGRQVPAFAFPDAMAWRDRGF